MGQERRVHQALGAGVEGEEVRRHGVGGVSEAGAREVRPSLLLARFLSCRCPEARARVRARPGCGPRPRDASPCADLRPCPSGIRPASGRAARCGRGSRAPGPRPGPGCGPRSRDRRREPCRPLAPSRDEPARGGRCRRWRDREGSRVEFPWSRMLSSALVSDAISLDEAFAYCEARTKAHYENFPVGLFVPKDKRPYVHALYAFARAADDFADEPIYEGMRREKLDQWEARLARRLPRRGRGPDLRGARRDRAPPATSRRSCCSTCSRPSARTPRRPATRPGTSSSTTAAARRTRWAGSCCSCSATRRGPAAALRRDLHRPPAREPLAGRGDRLRKDRIYIPRSCAPARRGRVGPDAGRASSDGWRALMGELIAAHPRALRRGPAAVRPRRPRPAVRDAPHLARRARASSTASRPWATTSSAAGRSTASSTRPASPGAPGAGPAAA